MDLEAEEDWQERLWHSLQAGQIAVVDLSEVTPFVLEEICLVSNAIGVERVIFIGDSLSQTKDQLSATISEQIGTDRANKATIYLWQRAKSKKALTQHKKHFKDFVRRFYKNASALPNIEKEDAPAAYQVKASSSSTKTPMSRSMLSWMIWVQVALVFAQIIISVLANFWSSDVDTQAWIKILCSLPFILCHTTFFFLNIYIYIRDVGIFRRRLKAIGLLFLLLISFTPIGIELFVGEAEMEQRTDLSLDEINADRELVLKERASAMAPATQSKEEF